MEDMMQGTQQQASPAVRSKGALKGLVQKFATWAANIFGSDIYMRIGTLQFWDSNQVAHAMMGFAGTTLTSLVFVQIWDKDYACLGILFMILPIWRDVIDYMVDTKVFDPQFSGPFLHKAEVLRDCLTDSSFWLCGSLLAITTILAGIENSHGSSHAFAWFAIATGLTVWHGISHYKPQKLRFDQSGIPYFVRLAKLNALFFNPDESEDATDRAKCEACEAIRDFLDLDAQAHVMIIAGGDDSGKTTLACGLATEFAVSPERRDALATRYILMGELYSMVRRERGRYGSSGVVTDSRPLSAAAADVLFIDEAELTPDHLERLDNELEQEQVANGATPEPAQPVPIADSLKFLLLGKKRIVLIVHRRRVGAWHRWLEQELCAESPIPTVWIQKVIDDDSVQPSSAAKWAAASLFAVLLAVLVLWLCALLYTGTTH
jgi:hypothetical protein